MSIRAIRSDTEHLPCAIILDHHPADSRTDIADDQNTIQTLTSRMGTGGAVCYSEKRFFEWHEDELSVSLRAKSGSYGGGSEVLVCTERGGNVDKLEWGADCSNINDEQCGRRAKNA